MSLVITDLHANVLTEDGPKEILKGVNLTINPGEIHAIMGPNGSGKSTLAYAISGHPKYEITSGSVTLDGIRKAILGNHHHQRRAKGHQGVGTHTGRLHTVFPFVANQKAQDHGNKNPQQQLRIPDHTIRLQHRIDLVKVHTVVTPSFRS